MNPLYLLFIILLAGSAVCPALEGVLTPRAIGSDSACPYGYLEYLPAGYATSRSRQPLVVCFHGNGDEGDGDGDLTVKLIRNGAAKVIHEGRDIAAVVLCPQAKTWFDVASVDRFITYARTRYPIDAQRIYLIGHSAGGSQVWNYTHEHPDVPAAIVPICGASNPANPEKLKDPTRISGIPVWAFHCFDDPVVGKGNTIRWLNGIAKATTAALPDLMATYPTSSSGRAADADYTVHLARTTWQWNPGIVADPARPACALTLYKSGGHDAWTSTYGDQKVWDWLLAQHRDGVDH